MNSESYSILHFVLFLLYFRSLTFFFNFFNISCESIQPSIMDTVLQPSVLYRLSNNKIKLVKNEGSECFQSVGMSN
jgi:hypothetical protein